MTDFKTVDPYGYHHGFASHFEYVSEASERSIPPNTDILVEGTFPFGVFVEHPR